MFKNFFQVLNKNQKRFFFVILLLILLNAVLETIGIAAIIPLINLIIREDFVDNFPYLSNILLNISQIFLPESTYSNNSIKINFVIAGAFCFAMIFLIKTLFYIFLSYVQTNYTNDLTHSISVKLYKGYMNLDYIFHTIRNSTNLKQNILEETGTFTGVFNSLLIVITESIILLFISIFLISYNFKLSIIIVIFLSIVSLVILKTTRSKLTIWGTQRLHYMEERFKLLQEGVDSIKEIYILQKPIYFLNNFSKSLKNYLISTRNYTVILNATRPIFELVGVISLIILLLVLVLQGDSIPYLLATLGLFLAASFRLLPSLNKIIQQVQNIKFNLASIDRILGEFRIINENYKLVKSTANIKFEKEIIFNNVSFTYPNKKEPALDNVSFIIKKGSKVGIKGSSGSGKSTLINLILTLTKATKGQIKIDNFNLEQNNLDWLKTIGYVPQDINLIDDTIEKNIAFGLPLEQIDKNKLKNAIISSQLSNFIDNLKDGIKTRVGEKGQMISGGQKQRIGIARALYNDPSIIILDESTSSLDLKTEKLIMDIIYNLERHKTIIIVSHRESALDRCDKIISISNKKVIEGKNQYV